MTSYIYVIIIIIILNVERELNVDRFDKQIMYVPEFDYNSLVCAIPHAVPS